MPVREKVGYVHTEVVCHGCKLRDPNSDIRNLLRSQLFQCFDDLRLIVVSENLEIYIQFL